MTRAVSSLPVQGLSLRANFSWTLAGNLVYALCQWGILVLLAKLTSPERVGQFALGLAVTAPVIMFSNLKLRTVQATDTQGEFAFGDYLGHRYLFTLLGFLLIVVLSFYSGYRMETALIILAVGGLKSVEAISDIHYGFMQRHEQMDRIAKSMLLRGPLSLIALGSVLFSGGSLLAAIGAAIAVWFLILRFFDMPGAGSLSTERDTEMKARFERDRILKLSVLALPLGVSMFLLSLNVNLPRYFIESNLGERELGIFAALAYLMTAGLTVVHALGQSATPRLARHFSNNEHRLFVELLLKLVGIGVVLGVGAVGVALLFGREVLTLLYGVEYAGELSTFTWLMVASGIAFVANFLGYGVNATRAFHRQLLPFCIITVVTLGASAVLIPRYGLAGAAWALVIANLVNVTLFAFLLRALLSVREGVDAT